MRLRRRPARKQPLAPAAGAAGALDPEALVVWARRYTEQLRVKAYSERTVQTNEAVLDMFVRWTDDRGIGRPAEVSRAVLESYQRWLFYYRKPDGKPLGHETQRKRLQLLRGLFRWLTRQHVIPSNPAADLELPRVERRLPKAVLSEREVETVLALPDTTDPIGLRDRAMMEVFYATGIRRAELAALSVVDTDPDRGTLCVRLGKGRADRVVPIGERALAWVARYLDEARAELVVPPDEGILFLSDRGQKLDPIKLTTLMRRYVDSARLGKHGACHIFRHTMATLMLEGGADVRVIQEILGHVQLSTTQIYTRVSIRHLKNVYDVTHPGAKLARRPADAAADVAAEVPAADAAREHEHEPPPTKAALLGTLAAEARDEARDAEPGAGGNFANTRAPSPAEP